MKISKSQLKPKLFSYLREVARTGKALVITERGRPVLKIVPVGDEELDPIGSLRGLVEAYRAPLEPLGAVWKAAERDE